VTSHLCLLGDANAIHTRRWATEMLARGFRVSIVTARPQPLDGVQQRVLAPVRGSRDWLFRIRQTRRLVDALAPDIIHSHYVTSYGFLGACSGHRPLLMTAWGSDILVTPRTSRLMRWLTGWTLRRADLVTADSADVLAEIARYRPAVPARLVHWGADTARFGPGDWHTKTGFQVVSLRSWEPNYNIDVVLRAMALLCARLPEAPVHLHLLGGGSRAQALESLADSLGIGTRVTFHGRVDEAAMVAVIRACKVSVSVPSSDATSVSVLESMACGVPVVASDLPANREWVEPEGGDLVPVGDAVALASALEALYRDDRRAQAIGRAMRERMLRDGSRSVQMDAMAAIYRAFLGRPTLRPAT
jgi:glycosyltransferase involved in cell wall biosynthesis